MTKLETLQERAARLRADQEALTAAERPLLDRAAEILGSAEFLASLAELEEIRMQLANDNARRALEGLAFRVGFARNVVSAR